MKKILCVFLCFLLLFGIAACKPDKESIQAPVTFYYRQVSDKLAAEQGVIVSEEREAVGHVDDLAWLLQEYFRGAQSQDLIAPFPRSVQLLHWSVDKNVLNITLSQSFAQLRGIDLTVACACITLTFLELSGAEAVSIRAENATLGGQDSLLLRREDFHLFDDGVSQTTSNLTLYYADNTRRYLIGLPITVNIAAQDNIYQYLLEQLLSSPADSGLLSPIPSGTRILGVSADQGLCSVDLSSEFEDHAFTGAAAQRSALLSIVNTLCQLPEVKEVEFYKEGVLMTNYQLLTLDAPFVADPSILGPVLTGLNELDGTLYVFNGKELYLTSVPARIKKSAGAEPEELLLQALLDFQNINGYINPVPSGTKIRQIYTENGLCRIDLSEEFISKPEYIVPIVRSVVATVCSIDGINRARITVNGAVPSGFDPSLFGILLVEDSWYLN